MTQIMSESINAGLPKNEGCTRYFLGRGSVSLHQCRASFTNITAEPYKIRASKASVDEATGDYFNIFYIFGGCSI